MQSAVLIASDRVRFMWQYPCMSRPLYLISPHPAYSYGGLSSHQQKESPEGTIPVDSFRAF
jgi:hypothetical protein